MTVDRSTETMISSGSSDCEAKALTVMPCIRPAAVVVMTVTPLAKWPMTWRKDALSRGWFTPIRYGNVRRPAPGSAILGISDFSSRRSMRFSTRSEYGIRVMVRLGRGYGNGPIAVGELAEQEGLPPSYLAQIAGQLRR